MGDTRSDSPVVAHMLTLSQIRGESGKRKPDASTQQEDTAHRLHKDAYNTKPGDSSSQEKAEGHEHASPLHIEVYGHGTGKPSSAPQIVDTPKPELKTPVTAAGPDQTGTSNPSDKLKADKDASQECDYRSRNIERKRPDWTRCIPDD